MINYDTACDLVSRTGNTRYSDIVLMDIQGEIIEAALRGRNCIHYTKAGFDGYRHPHWDASHRKVVEGLEKLGFNLYLGFSKPRGLRGWVRWMLGHGRPSYLLVSWPKYKASLRDIW